LWGGLAAGALLAVLWLELPYVNWRRSVAPLDQQPLVIREDAKGDGRFEAPRSGRRKHRGIDLAAPKGSPVRTIRSGTILQTGRHRGLGRFVEVEHRGGLRSLYAHLDAVEVEAGSRVRQGQVIGTVGKTGNARHPGITPHVHLEVTKDGVPVNPELVGLKAMSPEPSTQFESADERDDASGGE
jgi:murein DD-endopeptidase MepM/ murein hydrolase activator NlpD